jgi:hypothetical protein
MKFFPILHHSKLNVATFSILCACILSFQGVLIGIDYFVSPLGNDSNPGTEVRPWKTIQKAAGSATPGSTVYVKAGTYKEKIAIKVQGDPTNGYITFQNYGADHVVISGANVKKLSTADGSDDIIYLQNKSYVRIIGFEIRDLQAADGSGIRFWGAGNHIEIRNNIIHNIHGGGKNGGAMGITIYGANNTTSINNLIIDGNEIYDCQPAWSEALTLNGNIEQFQVTNNKVHDVNNIGIDFIGGESWISTKYTRNGICKGNLVYHARSSYGGGYAAGIYVDGGNNILLDSNEVYECDLGIEIGSENKGTIASGIIVQNNYIHTNDKVGIVFGGYDSTTGTVQNCEFTNNIFTGNDTFGEGNGELWIQYASNNLISYNTFTPTNQNIIVTSTKSNKNNTMNYDSFHITNGIKNAVFIWKSKTYKGLSSFQNNTGQEANAMETK